MDELIEAFLSLTDSSPALSIDPRRPHHCPTTLPIAATPLPSNPSHSSNPHRPHHCPATLPIAATPLSNNPSCSSNPCRPHHCQQLFPTVRKTKTKIEGVNRRRRQLRTGTERDDRGRQR
ncbi:hypothetical protein ACFE04_022760 [Oxalis oulophora]